MDLPTYEEFEWFIRIVIATAKEIIPKSFRREFIPGWTEDTESLFRNFNYSGDSEIAVELLYTLNN